MGKTLFLSNERIKHEIFQKFPEAVIDMEFDGEVQFFRSEKASENIDNLWSAYYVNGHVEMTNDF